MYFSCYFVTDFIITKFLKNNLQHILQILDKKPEMSSNIKHHVDSHFSYLISTSSSLKFASDSGGAKRDRTADLLRARQALSQLSYSPFILTWTNSPD